MNRVVDLFDTTPLRANFLTLLEKSMRLIRAENKSTITSLTKVTAGSTTKVHYKEKNHFSEFYKNVLYAAGPKRFDKLMPENPGPTYNSGPNTKFQLAVVDGSLSGFV